MHPLNLPSHQVGRDYAREEYAFDEKQQRGIHRSFLPSFVPSFLPSFLLDSCPELKMQMNSARAPSVSYLLTLPTTHSLPLVHLPTTRYCRFYLRAVLHCEQSNTPQSCQRKTTPIAATIETVKKRTKIEWPGVKE